HVHDIGKSGFHRVAETQRIQTARHQRGTQETNHLQAEHAALGREQITTVPGLEQGEAGIHAHPKRQAKQTNGSPQ
ncbi:MAG: hypothetical protein OXU49_07210, partial [Cyanobacteria bacterium MAG STY2_bin_7]|nr:hypothetical protein [Cyanobacteria bacterium MAG STY2_bin_7]